ncbi:unnamed protein product [Arctia plantaginis]|uniref:BTB domain-containing protein n=1 Tax=Arctia plantaginis TaxID=874455 RepID=A0A8S0ZNP4_ARCPL|nr:unnamed protein product [Arctia plantaginis]
MDTHFSLSWDAYQKNICSGLSMLQQRGEFVDMTLAADSHHVKVHQMVLSLVSPYIKELISSAQCPHPVIFLNNISYATLCLVLEYIYTGEVYLPKANLSDFLAAGRALHIKGIQDMEENNILQDDTRGLQDNTDMLEQDNNSISGDNTNLQTDEGEPHTGNNTLLEQLQKCKENKKKGAKLKRPKSVQPLCKIFVDDSNTEIVEEFTEAENVDTEQNDQHINVISSTNTSEIVRSKGTLKNSNIVQYSLSNQGGLQMIFNRYIYALKYVQKKLIKFWRCADSGSKKCPANIYTNQRNQVIKRTFNHNHPFHDKNILKKMRLGLVFTAFNEAESRAFCKKDKEPSPPHTAENTDSE